jgi:hypothetical protein
MAGAGGGASGRTLHTSSKFPVLAGGSVTQESTISFPAGGLSDQLPIINLILQDQEFTERSDRYLDIGATDSTKDLDTITTATLIPVYLDPAFLESTAPPMLGVLPPKCVFIRCLVGSGFLYLNLPFPLDGTELASVAPLPLHAGVGLFSYVFPRDSVHTAQAAPDPTAADERVAYPLSLSSIYLRTHEAANRFQIIVLK